MTFTLELPDTVVQSLKAEAETQHVPLQEWIVLKLQQGIGSATSSTRINETSEEFEAAVKRTLEKNAELYRRLA